MTGPSPMHHMLAACAALMLTVIGFHQILVIPPTEAAMPASITTAILSAPVA